MRVKSTWQQEQWLISWYFNPYIYTAAEDTLQGKIGPEERTITRVDCHTKLKETGTACTSHSPENFAASLQQATVWSSNDISAVDQNTTIKSTR